MKWNVRNSRRNSVSYRVVHSVRAAWVLMSMGWRIEKYATDGITLSLGA